MVRQIMIEILGSMTHIQLVTSYVFVLIGLFIKWYFTASQAIRYNKETPSKFSVAYWWHNNRHKITAFFASLVIVFVSIRFPHEILGMEWSYFYALTVGLLFDYVVDTLKKRQNEVSTVSKLTVN